MSAENRLTPVFYRRDFSAPLEPSPPGDGDAWRVKRCHWSAVGGPMRAELARAAPPGPPAPWQDLLRCPVELLDLGGNPAWWGYISAVELRERGGRLRWALDGYYNSVRVDYLELAGGEPAHVFTRDERGAAEWGEKQFFYNQGADGGYWQAQALAEGWLGRLNRLERGWRAGDPGDRQVWLELRGWWDTLGWRFWHWMGEGTRAWETTPTDEVRVGYSAATQRQAQGFAGPLPGLPCAVSRARFYARVLGSPSDALRVSVLADAGGLPTGTALDTATLPAYLLSGSLGWVQADFPALAAAMQPGQTYHLVFERTGAASSSHYYQIGIDPLAGGVGGLPVLHTWNGSAWAARSPAAVAVYVITQAAETADALAYLAAPERGGQFLAGARVEDSVRAVTGGGVWVEPARGTVRSFREEMEALVGMGAPGGGRLVAWIDPRRWLRVRPAAAVGADLLVAGDGALLDRHARPLPVCEPAVGRWARPVEWADAPAVFVERAVFDGERVIMVG